RILQINNPAETPKHSEHLLPMRFPEFSVPTFDCRTFKEFTEKVHSLADEVVAKPLGSFGGMGLAFFSKKTSDADLEKYWKSCEEHAVVQPFLKEIALGDVRVLTMNKKIVGSVRRIPKKGSRLANLHQGASAEKTEPTREQVRAALTIAEALHPL